MSGSDVAQPITMLVAGDLGGVTDFAHQMREVMPHTTVALLKSHLYPDNLDGKHLVLHYSGYELQKRGTPLWLMRRVQEYKRSALSFGVFFHELYAKSPPWRSAFWLSPWQQFIVKKLAESADYWITNRQASANWIARHSAPRPHKVMPVCSNVGEFEFRRHARQGGAIIFGTPALRAHLYRLHGRELLAWARQTGLPLHDIGAPITDPGLRPLIEDPCVTEHGRLSSHEVSLLLSSARYGLLSYPGDAIAKSGVFAAYCAHGLCPVVLSHTDRSYDGLESGTHYLSNLPPPSLDSLLQEHIALQAWQWYWPHRKAIHAQTLAAMIRDTVAQTADAEAMP